MRRMTYATRSAGFREVTGPALGAVQHSNDVDPIRLKFVDNDIGCALDDQFACVTKLSRTTGMRERRQHSYTFHDASRL